MSNPYIKDGNLAEVAEDLYKKGGEGLSNLFGLNGDKNSQNGVFSQLFGTNLTTNDFLKGILIGAAATYLLTNENAQKTIFKAMAKGSEVFQAGLEEMKERFEDAKAEIEENS